MTSPSIFRDDAPLYWARGLSVVPGEPGSKRPASTLGNWAGYCNNLPAESTRTAWLERYADRSIGLLTNIEIMPGFALGAVDVDRNDLVRVVEAILGKPISAKRGKKGITFFVRVAKADKLKRTALVDSDKVQAVDVLIGNSHTVLPPSLHPDTGVPYAWVGKPLLECAWEELPVFNAKSMPILKRVVRSEFSSTLIRGEATHEAGLRLVAQLVAFCTNDEVYNIVRALLPLDYSGNSLDEIAEWTASARNKRYDEERDEEPDTLAGQVVKLALGAGIECFNDGESAFVSIPSLDGQITYGVSSSDFEKWLRHQAFKRLERPIGRGVVSDAVATLEAHARYEGQSRRVEIRLGGNSDFVEVDLGRPDGRVVRIGPEGWHLADRAEQRFYRSSGFEPLPDPVAGGDLEPLRRLLGLDQTTFALFIAFLGNALKPTGPYMALLVEGEQGSGKSFFCHVAKSLIDPNRASKLRLPDNERDLMIQAKTYRLLVYDNASGMRAVMSDVLCSLATGAGFGVRRLYANDELQVFAHTRPFIINGISGYAKRPDLLERALPVRLQPMDERSRKTEGDMLAEFERIRPAVLGVLYDAVSTALRRYGATETPLGFRMADAARWIAAAEPALRLQQGSILAEMLAAQDALAIERINDDALVIGIREVIEPRPDRVFEGYIGELFKLIDPGRDRTLPKTTQQLSSQLMRLRPTMAKAGLHIEFVPKDKRGRKIRIWSSLDAQAEANPSSQNSNPKGRVLSKLCE